VWEAIVLTHPRCLLALAAVAPASLTPLALALAFDDREFCVAAEQFALAANKDIGVWIDRVTRNAGMVVSCNTKMVEFKRFTYAPPASMSGSWKERKAEEWNARHCNSPIWTEAIRNGWKIVLSLTAADGGHVSLTARCR
jgi:hypothetical protein